MKGKAPAVVTQTTAAKRIKKEITDLTKEDLGDIQLGPNEANIFAWKAVLPGPKGSAYEGGVFDVDIKIPSDYPFSPPKLQFMTKVYHCNIAPTGAICLDLLKTAWSPALSLYKVILSLSSLLTDPNPSDPLVPAIAQEYRTNRKKHDTHAREWVKLYAQPPATKAAPPPAPAPKPSRPEAINRPSSSASTSTSNAPPTTVIGRRRRDPNSRHEPIDLADDDEEEADTAAASSDIEVLDADGRPKNQAGGSANPSGGHIAAVPRATDPAAAKVKTNKKARTGPSGGGHEDDVIVIDD